MKKTDILYSLFFIFIVFPTANTISQNCILTCKDTVYAVLDEYCQKTISNEQFILDSIDCQGNIDMFIKDYLGNQVDINFNETQIGKFYIVTLKSNMLQSVFCSSVLKVVDTTSPVIICPDLYSECISLSKVADNVFALPTVIDNCSLMSGMSHSDTFIEMDCDQLGFKDSFSPDHWTTTQKCTVNNNSIVLFKPDTLNLKGDIPLVSLSGGCESSVLLEIPFESVIHFSWQADSLNFTVGDSFGIRINNSFVKLNSFNQFSGKMMTDTLKKGAFFEFMLYSDGFGPEIVINVFDFMVKSNIKAIIERKWKAEDVSNNSSYCTQRIYIMKNHLDEVQFPANFIDSIKTNNSCAKNYTPELTGWPFIKTGKYNTSLGIMELKSGQNECLVAEYTDFISPLCEGSYELTREWKVIEYCSGDTMKYYQTIKVLDVAPPVISSLKSIVIPANSWNCAADVVIPLFSAFDQCSPTNLSLFVKSSFGGIGYGPHQNVSVGKYKLFYSAVDGCGNKSEVIGDLEVKDITSPIAICHKMLTLSLDENGKTVLNANQIDKGCTDNCCLKEVKIGRKNDPLSNFSSQIMLNCNDSQGTKVILKASDCYENIAYCETSIELIDIIEPTIICPKDLTVGCENDLSDLSLLGQPVVYDNCNFNIMYTQANNMDNCNKGSIERMWHVSDSSNNQSFCKQNIHVQNLYNWNTNSDMIKWPNNYISEGCKIFADLKPTLLPFEFSQPVIKGTTKCTNLDVTYIDILHAQSGDYCFTVERKWTVLDKCAFNASNGLAGKWEHTQTLSVTDKVAPELLVPNDITVVISDNACTKFVDLPDIKIIDCDNNLILSNDKTINSNSISDFYPVGITKVTIVATDHCGNSVTKFVTVTVVDGILPQIKCKQNVTIDLINLNPNGEMLINPATLSDGFADNCTPDFLLTLEVSPATISCIDLGLHIVTLTVSDASGNTSSCDTNLNITDTNGLCTQPSYSISGKIVSPTGQPVVLVDVSLDNNAASKSLSAADGTFVFKDLPKGENFEVACQKELLPLNGVSTYDLLLLNQHILGKKILDSPYKYIAADVNQNSFITTADYVIIKDMLLLNKGEFPGGYSWRFVPESFQFSNYHPILPNFSETIDIYNIQSDMKNANFIGVKLGDLNFSNNPSTFDEIEKRVEGNVKIMIGKNNSSTSGRSEIPIIINSDQELIGIQFELELLDSSVDGLEILWPKNSKCNDGDYHILNYPETGLVFSWVNLSRENLNSGDTLCKLIFIGGNQEEIQQKLKFKTDRINPEAYNSDYSINKIELVHQPSMQIKNAYIDFTTSPNPAINELNLTINSQIITQAEIGFYNLNGQCISSMFTMLSQGLNNIVINDISELNPGICVVKITMKEGFSVHKKICINKH